MLLLPLLLVGCELATPVSPPAADVSTPPAQSMPVPAPEASVPPATDLLARGLYARSIGNYDAAAADLHALLTSHPAAPEARPASFYLAESFALRGRWTSAVEALRAFVQHEPQDDLYARALFLLARGQEEAGAWEDAIATFERYRALQTPLEPYARLRQAAQEQALGRLEQAARSYEAAAAPDIVRGERAGAYVKAIALRQQLGQNDLALELYRRLLELLEDPADRARVLIEAAGLAGQLGAVDQVRTWLREAAEVAPATSYALDATNRLLADPQGGLAPTSAAQVYMAHEQWEAAIGQFDAALLAATGEQAFELRRQRALARRALGDFANALAELAAVAAESPNSEPGRQAQLDWVQTAGHSGDTQGAIAGYQQFAQAYPEDARAPEALSRAAILLARLGDAEGSAQQQLDLGRRYPRSEQAHDALYEAGWYFFRAGRMDEAYTAWDQLRQNSSRIVSAQAAFWAARASGPGTGGYNTALEAAIAAAPDSYYGARAAELLGRPLEGSAPIGSAISEESWRATEAWIASWSGSPVYHLAEQDYPAEVAEAGPARRAIALQEVGLQPESIAEWNEARTRWQEDPLKLYLLARLAHEHGVPYIALKAAEDLAKRSPDKGFANAPEALRRLIFPTPYSDLVIAEARERQLDPRVLYAMMRQESLFNPGATSWVGARGLAQVMPATAEGIAQNLAMEEFQESDLYRPAVSVRFGAFYLSRQIEMMEGSIQGALSAYNGGPGNAQRWAGGTTVADPDLFTEAIDYDETRGYVKLVYGYYGAYQRLYSWP